ncbi:nuclear transport factor 2 family protein [Paraburkholderia phymatum]|uniref:nuclear transport factor 2 family protein n=1 Tax=Paraburkholderia phymatum TaxID=148447 RepID=UPI00317B08F4
MSNFNAEDIEAIKAVRARYFRAMDTGDYDLFRSLLTEDLVTDLKGGNYHFEFNNREDFIEAVASALNSQSAARHFGHMPEIILTGPDTAEGIWYFQDWALHVPSNTVMDGSGIIHDHYRKEHGQWRICRYSYRRVVETVYPWHEGAQLTVHRLGETGRAVA